MNFMSFLKTLLISLLYKLGLGKEPDAVAASPLSAASPDYPQGTQGRLDVPAALLQEEDRVVLVIEYDFNDVPSWVEWDLHTGKVNVVQMGGAVAELVLELPASARGEFEKVKRLVLVTGKGVEKLTHFIAFIIRDK